MTDTSPGSQTRGGHIHNPDPGGVAPALLGLAMTLWQMRPDDPKPLGPI